MSTPFGIDFGELAQLARAPALHAGGRRFDSDILHIIKKQVIIPAFFKFKTQVL